MESFRELDRPLTPPSDSESMQAELDLRLFHLKTLYDVSHELLGVVDLEMILRNFLLMTLGNFGVAEGFVLTHDARSKEPTMLVCFGFGEDMRARLAGEAMRRFAENHQHPTASIAEVLPRYGFMQPALACALAFHIDEGFNGLLGLGAKIIDKPYSADDKDLLETLINNLVAALKNAKSAQALQAAYEELRVLNRAKDRLIDHLSHELQTPVALLMSALKLLKKQLEALPAERWQRFMERAERSLQRLVDMQSEVEDIITNAAPRNRNIMSRLLEQCADELEILIAEQGGHGTLMENVRNQIDAVFGPKDVMAEDIALDQFVRRQVETLRPLFSHRQLTLTVHTEPVPAVRLPADVIEKLIVGLIKNAVENTPDEGRIVVTVKSREYGVELAVQDAGVGIVEEQRQHIFEGFFPMTDPNEYSSKKPFDFNAGGKGADLLRLKIFSERYHFRLDAASTRCRHIPRVGDVCPGKISACRFCRNTEDCYHCGGTTFTAFFAVPAN